MRRLSVPSGIAKGLKKVCRYEHKKGKVSSFLLSLSFFIAIHYVFINRLYVCPSIQCNKHHKQKHAKNSHMYLKYKVRTVENHTQIKIITSKVNIFISWMKHTEKLYLKMSPFICYNVQRSQEETIRSVPKYDVISHQLPTRWTTWLVEWSSKYYSILLNNFELNVIYSGTCCNSTI